MLQEFYWFLIQKKNLKTQFCGFYCLIKCFTWQFQLLIHFLLKINQCLQIKFKKYTQISSKLSSYKNVIIDFSRFYLNHYWKFSVFLTVKNSTSLPHKTYTEGVCKISKKLAGEFLSYVSHRKRPFFWRRPRRFAVNGLYRNFFMKISLNTLEILYFHMLFKYVKLS